jgi:serine phosphatase RsbU (regulator of sigma subunit)
MVIELLRRAMADREERRRMAEELAAAQQVQRLVISSSLSGEHQGWVVESSYLPMREVGGDFFQAWESPRGLLVAVGDVSGKGLKAAMTVSLLVGALRQAVSDEPAQILAGLNSVLLKSKDPGQFVTCCVMRLEADGTAVVAHAGHLPLYVDDGVLELEGSIPLGVVEEVEYRPQSAQARRAITVISDGVVEAATSAGELFGFDRTREVSMKSAREIAEAAKAWGQTDDITVVTVRRRT